MTLNLVEAAALLRIHKNTLQGRARAGVIPGAKTPSGLTPQTVRPRDDYHVLAIYEGHHYNRAGI